MRKIILLTVLFLLLLPRFSQASEVNRWARPGGDPSSLNMLQGIDSLLIPPEDVKKSWIEKVKTEQWEVLYIHYGDTLPELLFGGVRTKEYKHWWTTVCLFKNDNGEKIDSLRARGWSTVRYDTLETVNEFYYYEAQWTYIRVDTCHNATWNLEVRETTVKKIVPPLLSTPSPPPPLAEEPLKHHLGINWISKASHWNNDADPWIRYEEAELGLRFTWPEVVDDKYFENSNFHLEADVWPVMLRLFTVNNGAGHSVQLPLFQVQPKFFWRPTRSVFLMASAALTFNRRGWDSNTALALGQLHFFPISSGRFQPMLQLAGSMTNSNPRYLGDNFWVHNQHPESCALYKEIKPRLQILRFGDFVSLGWECTWFHFEKTSVDPKLKLTHDLQYISSGSPNPGGPYATFRLPWYLNADLSVVREHIDSEVYQINNETAQWVHGAVNEWRVNLVVSRGFYLQLW